MIAAMHAVLEDGWQAYQDANWDHLRTLLHEDIVWHEVDPGAEPNDYVGKDDVMAHFNFCRDGRDGVPAPYGVPQGRIYHVLLGDHAIVTDQVAGDHHRCTDIYRLVLSGHLEPPYLIREMWTCVTHPVEEGILFIP